METSYVNVIFKNDNNVVIKLPVDFYYKEYQQNYCNIFAFRDRHEVMFRRLHTYLIKHKIIQNNIIDLGAWIGDNSIPWAMNISKENIVYAIDPSPQNLEFIQSVCKLNSITNIKTIECAVSDKNETVYTNDDINHLTISAENTGRNALSSVSLDFLHKLNVITNIGYIHLDVEGYESKVIAGARQLLNKYKPIVSIEQHITSDDYMGLMNTIKEIGYNVYLINEVLPGCRPDCRNFIAFPNELDINIKEIHSYLGVPLLLALHPKQEKETIQYTASIIDLVNPKTVFASIKGLKHIAKNIYLFGIHTQGFTKIFATQPDSQFIEMRFLYAYIDVGISENLSNAFDTAHGVESCKDNYYIFIESA